MLAEVSLATDSQRHLPMPPVERVVRANVQSAPIDAAELEALVEDDDAGAVVSFVGRVRRHDLGRSVSMLEYSSHPSAESVAMQIARELIERALGRSEDLRAIALSHRVGRLEVGDIAIACAVSAGHRGQAFDACRELVERVKHELPIWKHQLFTDGTDEWVGSA